MSTAAITGRAPAVYKITVYADARGEFRWRMKAPNGRVVADSGEGYKTRSGAVAAAKRLQDAKTVLMGGAQ